jgi:hypothetical protein
MIVPGKPVPHTAAVAHHAVQPVRFVVEFSKLGLLSS